MDDFWRDLRQWIYFRVVEFLIFVVGFLLWYTTDAVFLEAIFWRENLSEAVHDVLFGSLFLFLLPVAAAFMYCTEFLYVTYAILIFIIVKAWFRSDKDWPTINLFTFVSHSLSIALFYYFRGERVFDMDLLTPGFLIGWITVAVLTYVSAHRLSRRLSG
ncbi:MAG: hypothetical protein J2P31_05100 [Blastocatellia bacterium]|nr:hypothetical protein [Blastocatellia bacterium]